MKMQRVFVFLVAVLIALVGQAPAAMLTNGDFESAAGWSDSWYLEGSYFYYSPTWYPVAPSNAIGANEIAIYGTDGIASTAAFARPTAVAGTKYAVDFLYQTDWSTGTPAAVSVGLYFYGQNTVNDNVADMAVGGIRLGGGFQDFTSALKPTTGAPGSWTMPTGHFEFTAPAGTQFLGVVAHANGTTYILDNVAVTAVPEPTSLALLVGLSVLGLRRRRS